MKQILSTRYLNSDYQGDKERFNAVNESLIKLQNLVDKVCPLLDACEKPGENKINIAPLLSEIITVKYNLKREFSPLVPAYYQLETAIEKITKKYEIAMTAVFDRLA